MYLPHFFHASLILLTAALISKVSATPLLDHRNTDLSGTNTTIATNTTTTTTTTTPDPSTPTSICTCIQRDDSNIFWYWVDIFPPSPATNATAPTSPSSHSSNAANPGLSLYHKLHPCSIVRWMPTAMLGADGAYSAQFYTAGLQDKCVEDAVRETEGEVVVCDGGDGDGDGSGNGAGEEGEGGGN